MNTIEQRKIILELLKEYPNSTVKELAEKTGLKTYTVTERLNYLHGQMKIERRNREGLLQRTFEYRLLDEGDKDESQRRSSY